MLSSHTSHHLPVAPTTPPASRNIGSIVGGVAIIIIVVMTTVIIYKKCGRSWQVNNTTTEPGGRHGDYSTAGLMDTSVASQVSGKHCSHACVPLVTVGCGY